MSFRGIVVAKWVISSLISALLMVCIWCAISWNNFAFHNALIADDYLMPVSMLALLIIILVINPLLRRFAPSVSFSRRSLCVMLGVLFMAALPPSAGILRQLIFPLGETVYRANRSQPLANAYAELDPPQVLFPDSLEYDAEIPVIEPFIDELEPGQNIPWRAWMGPMASWSGFVLPWFVMMVALATILSKYWQSEERVAFPLLKIFRPLVAVPDGTRQKIPPIFKNRLFWIGCGVVFFLHALSQAHRYFPEGIPAIPLDWHLSSYYSEPPWKYVGWWFKNGRLFFTFIAVAFFLPNRTSLSIWSIQVFTALYYMIGKAYFPPFRGVAVTDARTGAAIAFALIVLWLAHRHLAHVARCMVKGCASATERAYRIAGWCFVAGCAGMFLWFLWVRVPPTYSAVFVLAAVLAALVLMRVVAETGLPLFFMDTGIFITFLKMIPLSLRSLAGMYFGGILSVWIGSGQRVCVGAVASQAMALDEEDNVPRHLRKAGLFMLVLTVALVCGWLILLAMSYHYSETPDGRPVAWWGRGQFGHGQRLLMDTIGGVNPSAVGEHIGPIFTGGVMVVALYALCQFVPAWPIHPVGVLGAGTWCVAMIWPNIFFGWLIKNLLVKYGGSRAYTSTQPFFIGAVVGELFALAIWCAIAAILALKGMEFQSVTILPY